MCWCCGAAAEENFSLPDVTYKEHCEQEARGWLHSFVINNG